MKVRLNRDTMQKPLGLFLIALLIKCAFFVFFNAQFNSQFEAQEIIAGMVVYTGDAGTYYGPLDKLMEHGQYDGACRMPGLVFPYALFYWVFQAAGAKAAMVVFQILMDALAAVALFSLIKHFSRNTYWALTAYALYSLSTFVSIWNHHAISDSLATSSIVFTFWALMKWHQTQKNSWLLLASATMAWSIFIRPIDAIAAVSFAAVILHWSFKGWSWASVKSIVANLSIFSFFTCVAVAGWTARNFSQFDRFIPAQDHIQNCYSSYRDEKLAIRKLVLAWGCDLQEWSVGSEMHWFVETPIDSKFVFDERLMTSNYNTDSLIQLKAWYIKAASMNEDDLDSLPDLRKAIEAKTEQYIADYKSAHALDYKVLNHFRFLKLFLFPGKIENMPFPKLSDMRFYHKAIKGGYLVFFHLITLLACLTMCLWFSKSYRQWWPLGIFPLLYIGIMGFYLGFVEQRYLVVVYPFLVILAAFPIQLFLQKWLKKSVVKTTDGN